MLRLGKLADYGLLITTFLAKSDQQMTTEEVSNAIQLPLATVRKLMKLLVDAGIVVSQRGAKGGYQLASNPVDINIVDIIEAVDGPVMLTECSQEGNCCGRSANCNLSSNWQYLNKLVIQQFSDVSIYDMLGDLSQRNAKACSQVLD